MLSFVPGFGLRTIGSTLATIGQRMSGAALTRQRTNEVLDLWSPHSFLPTFGLHVNAVQGIFITSSDFSTGARDYVKNLPQRVILIDGERLAELMIEHNIGVSRAYSYEIKRVDSDYFEES